MTSRGTRFLILISLLLAVLLVSAGICVYTLPYTYGAYLINRKTGEITFIVVDRWFFIMESKPMIRGKLVHLADIGELTAPDRSFMAMRDIARQYPWSESLFPEMEKFEPGITYYDARVTLFEWRKDFTDLPPDKKAKADELLKRRLAFWNSSVMDEDRGKLLEYLKAAEEVNERF